MYRPFWKRKVKLHQHDAAVSLQQTTIVTSKWQSIAFQKQQITTSCWGSMLIFKNKMAWPMVLLFGTHILYAPTPSSLFCNSGNSLKTVLWKFDMAVTILAWQNIDNQIKFLVNCFLFIFDSGIITNKIQMRMFLNPTSYGTSDSVAAMGRPANNSKPTGHLIHLPKTYW